MRSFTTIVLFSSRLFQADMPYRNAGRRTSGAVKQNLIDDYDTCTTMRIESDPDRNTYVATGDAGQACFPV